MVLQNMNSMVLFALSIVALAAFLRSLVNAVLRQRLHREALHAEIQLRQALVARMGAPEDFRGFLELRPLTAVVAPDGEAAYRRIVQSTVAGSVLLIVALACAGLMVLTSFVGSPWRGAELLFVLGGVAAATAGLAFLVAAGVSYRMLRGWNLLPRVTRTAISS